ncbi:MAG: hypothetical protein ACI3Y6_01655 [Candidatus Cryptobacteroides sp.]
MWRKTGKHFPDGVFPCSRASSASALGAITRKRSSGDRDCLPNLFTARQNAEGNSSEGKTSGKCGGKGSSESPPGSSFPKSDRSV